VQSPFQGITIIIGLVTGNIHLALPYLVSYEGVFDYALPILNILVAQTGQLPWVAGLPFFMVMALASFISLLALHFIQYACIWAPPIVDEAIIAADIEQVNQALGCY